jgi:hypothetical protein
LKVTRGTYYPSDLKPPGRLCTTFYPGKQPGGSDITQPVLRLRTQTNCASTLGENYYVRPNEKAIDTRLRWPGLSIKVDTSTRTSWADRVDSRLVY